VKETERMFRNSESEKRKYLDGITMMSGGLKGMKLQIIQIFSEIFSMSWKKIGKAWLSNETKNINNTPTFAMIISDHNSRTTQVKTGMLFSSFQLKACTKGISMQPLSQSLQEFPEMSELYHNIHDVFAEKGQTIQMLVRMGRSDRVLHSLRRDVTDLIKE